MNERKTRVLREVSEREDYMLKVLDALKFATVENIKKKDGQLRTMEVKIRIDFDNLEEFKKILDELKNIPC